MAASKRRPTWDELPNPVRARIELLANGRVIAAENRTGGFSPGFASRLGLAGGQRVFVKAMDTATWPLQADPYRVEAAVSASLPAAVPAPRLLGSFDDGRWVILAFEYIEGIEPAQPWNPAELARVLPEVDRFSAAVNPSPVSLPRDHPRLGGWAELSRDPRRRARLRAFSAWAADRLALLVRLEWDGLQAAKGPALVHFDLYPHNILLAADRVLFVDWPHARLGAPFVDLLMLLSSAAADGIDPEPLLKRHPPAEPVDRSAIDAVLAAHAGFVVAGGLEDVPPELAPIPTAKLHLGRGALTWLERRLGRRH